MAILDDIHPEAIERLRGQVDFYKWMCRVPVARAWPKKPHPPYSALQASGMAAFSLAKHSTVRLSLHVVQAWRTPANGKQEAWADTYAATIMHYWKSHRAIPPIAIDYLVVSSPTDWQVKWYILQLYLDPATPEETYTMQMPLTTLDAWANSPKPIWYTLTNDAGERLAAPLIQFAG
jgi:hypothetical protein